jgi:hypothetical protein
MPESNNILTKMQELLVYLIPQLNKFPRDQKFGRLLNTQLSQPPSKMPASLQWAEL